MIRQICVFLCLLYHYDLFYLKSSLTCCTLTSGKYVAFDILNDILVKFYCKRISGMKVDDE